MISVNYVGRLGSDAELRVTNSGETVLNFRTATNVRSGKDEGVVWLRVALWGKRGEGLVKYLVKGREVFISGSLTEREYEAQGEKKRSLEVNAFDVRLVGGSKQREQDNSHAKSHASNTAEDDSGGDDSEIPF